jgi:hypothetical protein
MAALCGYQGAAASVTGAVVGAVFVMPLAWCLDWAAKLAASVMLLFLRVSEVQ